MNNNKYGVPISTTTDERAPVIQPKFKNRFRVFFFDFGSPNLSLQGAGTTGALVSIQDKIALTGNVVSFNRPTLAFSQNEIRSYIGRGSVTGRPTWENLNITLRDDIRNAAIKFIHRQVYLQQQKYMPSSTAFGRNFTFNMVLDVLDGRSNHTPVERWFFTSCSIVNVNFGDLSYESDTDVQRLELSISFNNLLVTSPYKLRYPSSFAANESTSTDSLSTSNLGRNSTTLSDQVYGVVDDATGGALDSFGGFVNNTVEYAENLLGKGYSYIDNLVDRGVNYISRLF